MLVLDGEESAVQSADHWRKLLQEHPQYKKTHNYISFQLITPYPDYICPEYLVHKPGIAALCDVKDLGGWDKQKHHPRNIEHLRRFNGLTKPRPCSPVISKIAKDETGHIVFLGLEVSVTFFW